MKKSILKLVYKLNQAEDGKLTGGFGHIRGGVRVSEKATNDFTQSCTNSYTDICTGGNVDCTNLYICTGASNTHSCSNSGACFA